MLIFQGIKGYFSYNSQKIGFEISCKLHVSPEKTICMKCQSLFSGKNKRNISKCCLPKNLHSMLLSTESIIL